MPDKTPSDTDGAQSVWPSSSQQPLPVKKEEPEDDFTFEEPSPKKLKTSTAPQGVSVRRAKPSQGLKSDLQMNWNLVEVQ